MANKKSERKKTAKANAVIIKKYSTVKKSDVTLRVPKKNSYQDSKKDLKKNNLKNNVTDDRREVNKNKDLKKDNLKNNATDDENNKRSPFLFLLFLILFFGACFYVFPYLFNNESKKAAPAVSNNAAKDQPSALHINQAINNFEDKKISKEEKIKKLNDELSKYISDQVQETLKKFDEKENSQEFRKCLLLLKKDSNADKERIEPNKGKTVQKRDSNPNKKVLLDFEKEKESCRKNLVTGAKSLQVKFEIDLKILSRSIADEKPDIFKKEVNILYENCQKNLANLIKKAADDHDKLINKIKSEVEKAENLNKLQEDREEAKMITSRFYFYVENKVQETLNKINRDFEEEIKKKNYHGHEGVVYNFGSQKFGLLNKVVDYSSDFKKRFAKDLDNLLKKRNPDDFKEKLKELFESYKKELSDFAKTAIDENYKMIKIMQKKISQTDGTSQDSYYTNVDYDNDLPWTFSTLVSIAMGFESFFLILYIFKAKFESLTLNIILIFLSLFADFFLLAIKKYGKRKYFERLSDMFFKHLLIKMITLITLSACLFVYLISI